MFEDIMGIDHYKTKHIYIYIYNNVMSFQHG